MSRNIYNTVYDEYNKYKSFKSIYPPVLNKMQTYKLLLDIIDDKNDDEINDFFYEIYDIISIKTMLFCKIIQPF